MEKLSRNSEKLIRSLHHKKFRKQENLFLIEGRKGVDEALKSDFKVQSIIVSNEFVDVYKDFDAVYLADQIAMKRVSTMKTPPGVLAVVEIRKSVRVEESDLILVLEGVKDPGNLGTIIRTADAFGIKTICCSSDTVDYLSPKVIQATMGSIFRVNIHYLDLVTYLKARKTVSVIYAAHLDGENIYKIPLKRPATLVMGNESLGISNELQKLMTHQIKIPIEGDAESFNVSIATSIIIAEFKRQFSES